MYREYLRDGRDVLMRSGPDAPTTTICTCCSEEMAEKILAMFQGLGHLSTEGIRHFCELR